MPLASTQPGAVTPAGVRDGHPQVLAALCARRGPSVLALAGHVCEPGLEIRAAADAMARFRAHVAAGTVTEHPDALLLTFARRAALELAPRGPEPACPRVPGFLAARAEQQLAEADAGRLERHLASCVACRALADGVEAGEAAYREAPDTPMPTDTASAIVAAMAAAAPIVAPAPEPVAAEPVAPPVDEIDVREPLIDEQPPLPAPPPLAAVPDLEVAPAEVDPGLPAHAPVPVVAEPAEDDGQAHVAEPAPGEEPAQRSAPPPDAGEDELVEELVDDEPGVVPVEELVDEEEDRDERPLRGPIVGTFPRPARIEEPAVRPRRRTGGLAGRAASARRAAQDVVTRRRRPDAPLQETPETAPDAPRDPSLGAQEWQAVDEIRFPARPPASPVAPRPAEAGAGPSATTARGRAVKAAAQPPVVPPVLPRPHRERHPLPLRAHGPAAIILPVAMLVVATLVILAVAGVFGGSKAEPPTSTAAGAPRPAAQVQLSATRLSLAEAQRIVATQPDPVPTTAATAP
jgi:hypothetical protein